MPLAQERRELEARTRVERRQPGRLAVQGGRARLPLAVGEDRTREPLLEPRQVEREAVVDRLEPSRFVEEGGGLGVPLGGRRAPGPPPPRPGGAILRPQRI